MGHNVKPKIKLYCTKIIAFFINFIQVAKEMSEISFAISDKDDFMHELNDYGIDFAKGDKPVVAGKDIDGNKFVMGQEFR